MSSSAPHKASIMSSSTADIFGHVKGRPLVLKGMTVQQPFCSAIVAGFKLVENRKRRFGGSETGWVALHAGKGGCKQEVWGQYASRWPKLATVKVQGQQRKRPFSHPDFPVGRIVALIHVSKCVEFDGKTDGTMLDSQGVARPGWEWAMDYGVCYLIDEVIPVPLDHPDPTKAAWKAKGNLGLWNIDVIEGKINTNSHTDTSSRKNIQFVRTQALMQLICQKKRHV